MTLSFRTVMTLLILLMSCTLIWICCGMIMFCLTTIYESLTTLNQYTTDIVLTPYYNDLKSRVIQKGEIRIGENECDIVLKSIRHIFASITLTLPRTERNLDNSAFTISSEMRIGKHIIIANGGRMSYIPMKKERISWWWWWLWWWILPWHNLNSNSNSNSNNHVVETIKVPLFDKYVKDIDLFCIDNNNNKKEKEKKNEDEFFNHYHDDNHHRFETVNMHVHVDGGSDKPLQIGRAVIDVKFIRRNAMVRVLYRYGIRWLVIVTSILWIVVCVFCVIFMSLGYTIYKIMSKIVLNYMTTTPNNDTMHHTREELGVTGHNEHSSYASASASASSHRSSNANSRRRRENVMQTEETKKEQ